MEYLALKLGFPTGELNYGDVAILCRASTSFGTYEDALERAGVPYQVRGGMNAGCGHGFCDPDMYRKTITESA